MSFKEFHRWCERRTCDGCWGFNTAIFCTNIISIIYKLPFWKRKKAWAEQEEECTRIVKLTNQKIIEVYGIDKIREVYGKEAVNELV